MANLKKWIIFGYLDIFSSVAQALVTFSSALVSVYFHFKNKKREGTDNSVEFAPTFNLVFALFAVYTNIGNIHAAKKLIKAEKNVNIYENNTQCKICIF